MSENDKKSKHPQSVSAYERLLIKMQNKQFKLKLTYAKVLNDQKMLIKLSSIFVNST